MLGLFLLIVIIFRNILNVGSHVFWLVQNIGSRYEKVASVFWHLSELFISAFETHLLVVGRCEDVFCLGFFGQLTGEDFTLDICVRADV
jgi:hypothetical protein